MNYLTKSFETINSNKKNNKPEVPCKLTYSKNRTKQVPCVPWEWLSTNPALPLDDPLDLPSMRYQSPPVDKKKEAKKNNNKKTYT